MMTIVATRKSALCAESFAHAMAGKNISHQLTNQIKMRMLNQFRGHINQLTGTITKSTKRYWLFDDGLGGLWRFDFVIYPVQELVIISSLYAVSAKQLPLHMQRGQIQRPQANESKSVVKLNEADLRYVVSEVSKRLITQAKKKANDCIKVITDTANKEILKGIFIKYFMENPSKNSYLDYYCDSLYDLKGKTFQFKDF